MDASIAAEVHARCLAVLKDSINVPEPGLVVKATKVLALGLGVSLVETTLL